MNTRVEDMVQKVIAWLPELILRPNTGRIWQDTLFLLVVVAIQLTILPSIFGRFLGIDLLTPWLVISCVRQTPVRASWLIFVAALSLETRNASPRGLYLCPYWIMGNSIIAIRETFSWRHQVPWLVTFLSATVFVVAFESFVYAFTSGLGELDGIYGLRQLVRIAVATGFGMLLERKWAVVETDKPVPQ